MPGPAEAPIYLDYAATTPVDSQVAAAMSECLTWEGAFANPGSGTHAYGLEAAQRVTAARESVAALIGAAPRDIVFTSGATESNNLALLGAMRAVSDRGRHLVTALTEHRAVIDPCRALEREGCEVTWLSPAADGQVTPDQVIAALRPDTRLVSLMRVNNELGVIQDIATIAAACRARGVRVHCDAAQAAGKVDCDMTALGVDFLAFTAHKIYGPKGIGALYVAPGARGALLPLMYGGGQERGLRPGTLATHQIVGFGAAAALVGRDRAAEFARLAGLRARLLAQLADLDGMTLNGQPDGYPGIINLSFDGVEGESLVTGLSELALSTGSACSSAHGEPSYVLRALGVSTLRAESSLRISLGRGTTPADIDRAANALHRELQRLRAALPQ